MQKLISQINLKINESLYLKDPSGTDTGHAILSAAASMIAEEGLDAFTFKKLATQLESTETTIYRYFQNKQQLLMYLSSMYWNLLEWKIALSTANLKAPEVALEKVFEVLAGESESVEQIMDIKESLLHDIVITEGIKAIHRREKDLLKQNGYFSAYRNLCQRIADLLQTYNPKVKHPLALASTLIETANYQQFLQSYLPDLTDIGKSKKQIHQLLHQITFTAL